MEYLIGALFATALFGALSLFISRSEKVPPSRIKYSQSHIVSLLSEISSYDDDEGEDEYDFSEEEKPGKEQKEYKVVFMENKAYWLDNGSFFVADANGDSVLTKTKRQVDTMGMSHVELNKIMKVVEALRGNDEDRNSGK